ncbi:hypothetical protein [Dyadobacter sp. CY323]|uniref:hypothetical protein n=1 Tax=Dyadobacter sp. CY323 TaxID=2907302 RepID=UPI001F1A80B3|nr:hypothetical protein [Dyadobacter sp. CY323]MCE6990905.1 hypothetical protein [Dyadobacter sp. CY323]
MIRTMLVPNDRDVLIHLPKSFVGKKVEVIVHTVNEPAAAPQSSDVSLTHFASQQVLSTDWSTPEEDKAWENL